MCLPYEICPGLSYSPRRCSFARVSACIPAIYPHSGPIAGLQVAGLMMTGRVDDDEKKDPFFITQHLELFFPGSLLGSLSCVADVTRPGPFFMGKHSGPSLRAGPWLRVHWSEWALFLLPILWGRFTQSGFFWAVGVWWDPCSSFVPYPLTLHRSKV